MDKARRLAKEAGAAAAEAGARAAHKAKDGARAATEAATAVAVTKAAASKQRAEAIYRGTDGLVDPHLQQKQVALKALGVCFAELSRGLRHERNRALESAKGAKETRDALTRIVEANHALRFRLQPAITSEAGLAARWEQLAGAIDAQLLSPAAVQLTAIFAEAEKVYAAYVAASPDPHPHPVPYIHPNEEVYDYVPAMLHPLTELRPLPGLRRLRGSGERALGSDKPREAGARHRVGCEPRGRGAHPRQDRQRARPGGQEMAYG